MEWLERRFREIAFLGLAALAVLILTPFIAYNCLRELLPRN